MGVPDFHVLLEFLITGLEFRGVLRRTRKSNLGDARVQVKIYGLGFTLYGWLSKFMVPFWFLIILRHLIFRVPKKGRGHNFDNHPYSP